MDDQELVSVEEENEISRPSWRAGLEVGGKVLLWMDLLPFMLTYQSIRDGSHFWIWWVLVEGLVGATMVVIGSTYRPRQMNS